MSSLTVIEHTHATYPPRTHANARQADLTVAFALDFNTAGERLTKSAAGERYTWIPLSSDVDEAAEKLIGVLRKFEVATLNIAGNGIYGLEPKGWPQSRVNVFVFSVMQKAIATWPVAKVISGGQTGADLAGVTAAHALGIPATALLPKGFLQRGLDNKDLIHSAGEIRTQVVAGADLLRQFDRVVKDFRKLFPDLEERHLILKAIDASFEKRENKSVAAEPRQPRIWNIKRDTNIPVDVVYIGRGTWRGQKSRLGNPFVIGLDGDRNAVCDRFEEWAPSQPEVMAEIEKLRGHDLACYCSPYRCHGNWIINIANRGIVPAVDAPPTNEGAAQVQFDPQI